MGCSASRLNSTRSATVRPRFLDAGMVCFPLPAPVPPLALLGGQQRVARLGHGCREHVLAANVDALAGNAAELAVKPDRFLPGEMLYVANAEQFKVAQHGWADGDEVLQPALMDRHRHSCLTRYLKLANLSSIN